MEAGGGVGGLMSILFWTTFTEGECIRSWVLFLFFAAASAAAALLWCSVRRESGRRGESLMRVPGK